MVHQRIPPEIQEIIKAHGTEITLQAGEMLFRQGDPSEGVYLVTQGKLTVHTHGRKGGDPTLLNYIMPGELTGEIGAITGWTRTATLTADRPTTLVRLSQKEFQKVLRKTPALAKLIMGTTGSFLLTADSERVNLGRSYQQMRMRVCALGEEKEQLQELLRLREEMEAMLVHDLRNPLNVVQTGITLLDPMVRECDDMAAAVTVVELMQNSVKRMQLLINTLLDIAKMEAGKVNLAISEFNLAALTYSLVNEQQAQFDEKDIEIESNVPLHLEIQADRDILYRILVNLLDNAFKFTEEGETVTVDITPTENSKWVEFCVTDTGPGIPEAERERIFEKFTQIEREEDAANNRRRGVGLGLTFCRMAVEAHGGRIWVESGPDDVGSSFCFKLPALPQKT